MKSFSSPRSWAVAIEKVIPVFLVFLCLPCELICDNAVTPKKPTFRSFYIPYGSSKEHLKGTLYLPHNVSGPYPAVLWIHGADKGVPEQTALAEFYTRHGYALFVPLRAGHNGIPGRTVDERLLPYIAADTDNREGDRRFVAFLDDANTEVSDALESLRNRSDIDRNRIAVSGISYGGILSLLLAGRNSDACGFIVFSAGARMWPNPYLQRRLATAAQESKHPIFLLAAKNDYSTQPLDHLGPILSMRGDGSLARLYPTFGKEGDIRAGHIGFSTSAEGAAAWGLDAIQFLRKSCPTKR